MYTEKPKRQGNPIKNVKRCASCGAPIETGYICADCSIDFDGSYSSPKARNKKQYEKRHSNKNKNKDWN